jgi:hypothetical protein
MHVYQMRNSNPSVVSVTQERLNICMNALKEVGKVWLVAKMVQTLFESILGNKSLEERLAKGAGEQHKKESQSARRLKKETEQAKRKFDEMDIGYNGPPAPQVSYERSRPQTPAVTPSRDLTAMSQMTPITASHNAGHNQPNVTSPQMRHPQDTFMGNAPSHGNTRPPTPFNPSWSIPSTPPDLYLVTRNSPPISQSLWENFQPDQLFPDGTSMNLYGNQFSPAHTPHAAIDPAMMAQMQSMTDQHGLPGQTTQLPQRLARPPQAQPGPGGSPIDLQNMQGMAMPGNMGWPAAQPFEQRGSPEDSWSNSSFGGPPVPTTLNVEDW